MNKHEMFHDSAAPGHGGRGFIEGEDDGSEHRCIGRGRHGGGHGGGHGFRPFGFGGGPGGFGFRSGRKLSAADLQLLILTLLGEKPSHGYELIKAIEERSSGFYGPSPGVIYPALTYLEEVALAASTAEGNRKLYDLTDAGRAHLAERRAEAEAILGQLKELGRGMDRVREAFTEEGEDGFDPFRRGAWAGVPELRSARRMLRAALATRRGAPHEELMRIAEILRRAAEEIERP
jgi:DNA-binding PadR family transcriptional regulator